MLNNSDKICDIVENMCMMNIKIESIVWCTSFNVNAILLLCFKQVIDLLLLKILITESFCKIYLIIK